MHSRFFPNPGRFSILNPAESSARRTQPAEVKLAPRAPGAEWRAISAHRLSENAPGLRLGAKPSQYQ
jgi:hypothetical protein